MIFLPHALPFKCALDLKEEEDPCGEGVGRLIVVKWYSINRWKQNEFTQVVWR